jgi:hypothetical protein
VTGLAQAIVSEGRKARKERENQEKDANYVQNNGLWQGIKEKSYLIIILLI